MGESKTEIRNGTCPVCNLGSCHCKVYIQDGKVVKITPDSESPVGGLCARHVASVDFHYHPDRINYPLKRVGDRGEGKWERISWEQAMAELLLRQGV